MLTAADLRGMARSGFHIASHTATHPYLPAEDEARQRREIETSRRDLEELLGQPVIDFCFPAGGYTTRICELVRDAGYRSAVTTDLGIAGSDDDPWRIPRIGVGTALATDPWGRFSGAMFETETSGYFADLYRRRLGARRE
jgi:peptidoglycan/xylan/chitin deacetylase (PgdA/CDA1 family)